MSISEYVRDYWTVYLFPILLVALGFFSFSTCDDWGCLGSVMIIIFAGLSVLVVVIFSIINELWLDLEVEGWKGFLWGIAAIIIAILAAVLFEKALGLTPM